ncbi:CLUMA_CG014877, isoform A [Clunio marinus]|uniref:CLUMA_CG014877, isoform A n=1 Tax=Clunio marinus TaxID=568069 RepID=A0A1J1IRF2_9DIPT|nr:CLUMA_CG014877, isoform A [Clunio marinus]
MSGTILRNLISVRRSVINLGSRHVSSNSNSFGGYRSNIYKWYWLFSGTGIAIGYFALKSLKSQNQIYALQQRKDELAEKAIKLTAREKRFIKFASVEFDGQIYCTPQDFIESVVEQEPRPRLKRKVLTAQEIQQLKEITPPLKHGSPMLFRKLRDNGIISYTEYLFLLSVLTKPQSGFKIAFNMFDTDGNQRVDKSEFLVLLALLSTSAQAKFLLRSHERSKLENDDGDKKAETKKNRGFMEKIFSFAWKGKRGLDTEVQEGSDDHYVDDEQGLQRKHKVDTTLQIHFFGKKGNKDLEFDGFYKFMKNLQTEVLELEFHEFSKGHEKISEVDFAKILLRYTYLDTDDYDNYLDRLLDREAKEKGVSFEEFRQFCQFLNNLEDFSIAMRMYTLADRSISKDEFARAVKICTGSPLNEHLIDTVFAIFDEDGDGLLSYKEFIAIMRDRLHRGFKVSNFKIYENLLDEGQGDGRFLSVMKSRACRRLSGYMRHFYNRV